MAREAKTVFGKFRVESPSETQIWISFSSHRKYVHLPNLGGVCRHQTKRLSANNVLEAVNRRSENAVLVKMAAFWEIPLYLDSQKPFWIGKGPL